MADGEIEREEEIILTETAIDAEWKRIQKKTFTRWCNEHLKKVCPDKLIEDIGEDFQDGIRLILLLEVISQKKVGRYNKKPRVYAQQMENIEKALNFITKTEKIYLVNIGSGDIHNGNVKLILGLIWTLIQHYQISVGFGIEGGEEEGKESRKTGKQALLEWLQKELPGKNITNFTKDWNDGTNIAALVDAKAPGLCPEHVDMDPKNSQENAAHAMKLAEDWLNVPMLLGPEDMVNPHVDELSMMTYLSQYPEAKLKEGAPIKVKEEPVKVEVEEVVMSKPELIKVGELHVPAEAGSGEDVWVEIDCSEAGQDKIKAECKGQTKIPVDIEELDSNKYRVKFTPTCPDVYSLSILYGDNLIPDGAIEINLLPKTDSKMVKHLGTFIPDDPTDPVVLKFDASKAGKGEMRARVSGVLIARTVDSEVKCADEETQEYEISFVPSGADQYNVDVYWSNKTIPGSPIYVNIVYAHEVLVSDPDDPIELLYPVVVHADTKHAGPGVLTASCSGDKTGEVDVEIASESPDRTKYRISFRPLEADHYSLRVFFDDVEIKHSPISVEVHSNFKPELVKVGELHVPEKAGSGEDVWVEMDCSEAGKGDLTVECKGTTNSPAVEIEEIDPMKYRVKFNPTQPDIYNLKIQHGDSTIPGGAFDIDLLPKSDPKKVQHLGTFIPDDPADPVILKFDASNAGEGEMRARVNGVLMAGPVDSEVKCVNEETKDYEVSFFPTKADTYDVDIYWSDESIPTSPISVKIIHPHEVLVNGPDGPLEALQPVKFYVDTQYAGPGVLTASCSGKEAGKLEVEILRNEADNTKYDVSFRPVEADSYSLGLFFDHTEIKNSPIEVEISPKFQPELVKIGQLHVPEIAGSGEDVWLEIDCSKAGRGEVKAECKGQNQSPDVEIELSDSNKHRIKFNPKHPDIYYLSIMYGDSIVPGGTFEINLLPKSDSTMVKHLGTFIPDDPADLVSLKFDASKAGKGEMRARVNGVLMAGPVDSEVKCVNEETQEYEVSFLPTKADTYDVDVYWSDESIPTSPISVKIVRPHEVIVSGPNDPLEPLQPVKVHVDTQYAGPGVLTASCSGKEAGDVDVEIIQNEADNTKYDVSFRPKKADSYSLKLFFDNTEIKNSPVEIEVSPKFQPELVTMGTLHVPERAGAGEDVWVDIDCSDAGKGEVKAECKGQLESPDVKIEQIDTSKHRVKFTPAHPDLYTLTISYGDSSIPGGTFNIDLLPKYDSKMVEHLGTSIPDDQSDPVVLKFDASKAGEGEMRARINGVLMAGPVNSEVKCVNEDTQEYEVSFLPTKADTYDVDVYWSDESIPASPISVKIVRPHEVLVSGPDGQLEPLQPVKVDVDTQYAGPGVLTASCSGKDAGDVDVDILRNEADNTKYDVVFRPIEADSYSLKLLFDNMEIKNSPVEIEVSPKFQPELVIVGELHVPERAGSGEDVWVDVDCSKAGNGEVKAECKGQRDSPNVEIQQLDSQKYRIKFNPTNPDIYNLSVTYGDSTIPGGTFDVDLLPKCDSKMVKHLGTFIPDNDADPVILKFDASKAGDGEMRARVNGVLMAGPVDSEVKCVDKETKDYEVSFLPSKADTYRVDVYWSDESIPTSPISVKIVRPHEVLVSGPDGPLETLQPIKVNADTQYAGPGVLTASCSGKEAGKVDVEIIRNEADNTKYNVSFCPVLAGSYSLNLFFDNTEIKRSPVKLEVSAKLNPELVKIGKLHVPDKAGSGENVWVEIDCSAAGKGDVKAECKGQKESPDTFIEPLDNMKYRVKFNPAHPDIYALAVLYGDSPIPGGNFDINLLPKTNSKMVKHLGTFLPDDSTNPVILKFDASKAGKGEMRAHVKSVMAGLVDPEIKCVNEEAQEYEVSFVPQRADTYDVEVLWSGEVIPDSPISVKIIYPHKVLVTGPDDPLELLQAVKVHVDTQYAGPGTLSALCSGKEAGDVDVEMICSEVDNTKYDVAFLPMEADSYSLRLFFDNVEIKDSPVKAEVSSNFKPELVKVGELHVPAKAGSGEDVWVEIDCTEAGKGEVKAKCNGRSKIPVNIEEIEPMKYRIKFTPKTPDMYGLTILYGDSIVPDGAFEIDLLQKTDSKMVKHLDTIVPDNRAAPVILKFDASKAGKGEMQAHVNGISKAKPVESKVKCINDMTDEYEVSFVPKGADTYSVNVFWSNQAIPSSPISVKIVYPDKVLVSGPDGPLEPLQPVKVHVDTQHAGPGVLTASCSGTKTGEVDVKMTGNEEDSTKHNVCFHPPEPDSYSLRLFFDNTEIKRSPVDIDVKKKKPVNEQCDFVLQQDTETMLDILVPAAEPDVVEEKPTELEMEIGDRLTLLVESEDDDAKSILTATASGRRVGEVPLSITQNDADRTYTVVLDPTEPDIYTLEVKMDDSQIPSSPFIINYTQPKKVDPPRVMLEPRVQVLVEPKVRIIEQQDEVPTHPITKPYLIRYVPEDGVDNLTAYAIHDDSCIRYVLTIRTKKEGTTLLVFNAEKTGLHFIHIQQGGKEIYGSPFKLRIVPSDPSACFVVDVPQKSYVGEESTITVDASKAGAGSMEVKAAVPVGGNGTQFLTTELDKGQHQIQFTPKAAGKHMLTVYWEGVPIPASPVPVNVLTLTEEDKQSRDAASRVSVQDSSVFSSQIDHTKGAKFVVHTAKAGQGELAIKSKGPGDVKIDVIKQKVNGNYKCRVRPAVSGKYYIEILWNGFPIHGSPFHLDFTSNKTYIINELNLEAEKFVMNKTYEYKVDCNKHEGELEILANPSDSAIADAYRLKDNIYIVNITPQIIGNHEISLKFAGKHLFLSPYRVQFDATEEEKPELDFDIQDNFLRLSDIDFSIDLSDPIPKTSQPAAAPLPKQKLLEDAKVTAFGPGLEDGIIGQEGNFTIKTDGCGDGKLIVAIDGPRGTFKTCLRHHPDHERTVLARYDPTHIGKYTINIKWMDKHIQGSPFVVEITPQ